MNGVRHVQLPAAFAPAVAGAGKMTEAQRGGYFLPGEALSAKHAKASASKAKAQKPQVTAETTAKLGRENLLDHAVRAGVINAGLRDHYRAAYDADPAGTKAFLQKIGLSDQALAEATQAAPAKPSRIVTLG